MRSSPRLIVFSIALIVFLANGRTISGGDSVPAKNLPLSILRHGNFYLDQIRSPGGKKIPYYLCESRGHYVSDYPVGAALMALPFYVPSVMSGVSSGSRVYGELEKISAATMVALSAVLLYMAAARVAPNWMALLLTFVYAFGTTSLSVSSQALWQHGPAQLELSAAIYCLVRARDDPRWAGYAGLPLAFEVITRPADVLIAAPLFVYVLVSFRKEIWTFIASAFAPIVFQLWYNAVYFGTPFRLEFFTAPQTAGGQTAGAGGFLATPFGHGLVLAVISPGRGLLFYSPIFVLSFAGLALAWRRNGDTMLRYLGVGVILSIILVARWHKPAGGESFGPRLLADLAPIMAFALYPLTASLRNYRALAASFAVLCVWSVTANASGAFISYRAWNAWAMSQSSTRLWLWDDNPVVDPFRSVFDSIRIALGKRPTSRTAPELLDSRIVVLTPPSLDVTPGAHVHISVRVTNIGRAVWLAGRSPDERGVVSLRWEWKRRDGKPVADSEADRELHLDVFPGGSTDLDASATAPDAPGDYAVEISLSAGAATKTISGPATVPVRVSAAPGSSSS